MRDTGAGGGKAAEDPFAAVDWMPDLERAANPWRQVLKDLVASAPVSDWAAKVTTVRVRSYDQIRVYLTRGALLACLAVLLVFAPGTSWLTWLLLLPALIQVVSEVVVDLALRRADTDSPEVLRVMAGITAAAHSTTLVNVTGVIGTLAVPANIVAVAYLAGPGDPAWVKVLGLAIAAAYGVSAVLSLLTDATNYSANQQNTKAYSLFRRMRPHLWLIVCVVMTVLVAGSVAAGRWAPTMVPLAWALCAMPMVIGMKQRDYERFLRASAEVIPDVQQEAKMTLCKDYHNTNNSLRTLNREIARSSDVPPEIRVKAAALAPLISLMTEAVDHDQWNRQQRRPSLAGIAAKCASDASLNADIDLRLDDLQITNYELARDLITALMINVGQSMKPTDSDRWVTVRGEVRDGRIRISVRDPLPIIEQWCREGSTMLWLHDELIAHGGVGLSQHALDDSDPSKGKEIRAEWPVKRPPLKLRDLRP